VIIRKDSLKQLITLLEKGRLDAIAYAYGVFGHAIKTAGGNASDYQEVMVLKEGKMGFAFHRTTSDEILAPLQKALDDLIADGTVKKIVDKYRQ
jgi:polar amino acid transport system substrate-binding protein